MKAIPSAPDQIFFRPQTDRDRDHLESMRRRGYLIDHGRDPETGQIIHATVRVVIEKEKR